MHFRTNTASLHLQLSPYDITLLDLNQVLNQVLNQLLLSMLFSPRTAAT